MPVHVSIGFLLALHVRCKVNCMFSQVHHGAVYRIDAPIHGCQTSPKVLRAVRSLQGRNALVVCRAGHPGLHFPSLSCFSYCVFLRISLVVFGCPWYSSEEHVFWRQEELIGRSRLKKNMFSSKNMLFSSKTSSETYPTSVRPSPFHTKIKKKKNGPRQNARGSLS